MPPCTSFRFRYYTSFPVQCWGHILFDYPSLLKRRVRVFVDQCCGYLVCPVGLLLDACQLTMCSATVCQLRVSFVHRPCVQPLSHSSASVVSDEGRYRAFFSGDIESATKVSCIMRWIGERGGEGVEFLTFPTSVSGLGVADGSVGGVGVADADVVGGVVLGGVFVFLTVRWATRNTCVPSNIFSSSRIRRYWIF